LDIAVVIADGMSEDPDLEITRMHRHQVYFVVRSGHPLMTANKAPTIQSMLKFPVVMTSRLPSAMLKRFLTATFGDKPIPSTMKSFPATACESVAMMKTIIAGTDAVALLPLNAVMAEVTSGQMEVLPLAAP
jgi:DNA-binding transcriptional LysR family regulator